MRFSKLLTSALALGILGFISVAPIFTHAQTDQPNWFASDTPTLTKYRDYASAADRPLITNEQCSETVEKSGSKWCAKDSNLGRIINGQLIEGNQSKNLKGYHGFGGINPVPNNPLFITTRSASMPGSYLGFYQHLGRSDLNQVSVYGLPARVEYQINREADYWLEDSNGHMVNVNTSTMAFSQNGYWMVFDVPRVGLMRVNMATMNLVLFGPSVEQSWETSIKNSPITISNDGKLAAVRYNNDLMVYDVDSCLQKYFNFSMPKTFAGCQAHDIWNGYHANDVGSQDMGIKGGVPNGIVMGNLKFINDGNLQFIARYRNSAGVYTYASYVATASGATLHKLGLLAMGDSYISGEGAFNYRDGTDTSINKCHQSLVSYPYLFAKTINSIKSVACSGAAMYNIRSIGNTRTDQLSGAAPSDTEQQEAKISHQPGVIEQEIFVGQDNPEAVVLSVGGNDVGFADIVSRCVAPFELKLSLKQIHASTSNNCYEIYEDRRELVDSINKQFSNLAATYKNIISDTDRRLYVIGYPQVVSPTSTECGYNVRLSMGDRVFASQLISYLDQVIEAAANQAGAYYVDTQGAFEGHKLCEAKPAAVNGLTAGNDKVVIGNESFHPNAYGHELLAAWIAGKTRNLTAPMPTANPNATAPTITDDLDLLQAPKVNRAMYELINAGKDGIELVNLASPYYFQLPSYNSSVMPNSWFNIELHSNPIDLGQVKSDANGEITGSLTLPATVPAGFHTLNFYGKNIAGDDIDIQKIVYVAASADDYDGDGIPNDQSSCKYIPDSGVDYDKDGIDDACDGNITEPPIVTPGDDQQSATSDDSTTVITTSFDPLYAQSVALQTTARPAVLGGGMFSNPTALSEASVSPNTSKSTPKITVLGQTQQKATNSLNRTAMVAVSLLLMLGIGMFSWRLWVRRRT